MQPPPMQSANFNVPPPAMPPQQQPHSNHYQPRHNHFHGGFSGKSFRPHFGRSSQMVQDDFDGKRLRKSVMRKTVDYNSSIVRTLEVSFLFVLFLWLVFPYF